jgi:hypothetical protein
MNIIRPLAVLLFFAAFFTPAGAARAGESHGDVPAAIDKQAKYLFYMHGKIVEDEGRYASHPVYGPYQYDAIVDALAARGFVVISEVRDYVAKGAYARKVAGQVKKLLAAGVAPANITVIGHSKGGFIAMLASAIIGNPDLNFVNMAGCGKGTRFGGSFRKFVAKDASRLQGRILSLYDGSDEIAGSCRGAFEKAAGNVESKEIVFDTGKGHGLFYSPEKIWIDEVVRWAKL